jgi:hypothetical protein
VLNLPYRLIGVDRNLPKQAQARIRAYYMHRFKNKVLPCSRELLSSLAEVDQRDVLYTDQVYFNEQDMMAGKQYMHQMYIYAYLDPFDLL